MIIAYLKNNTLQPHIITIDNQALLQQAVWIDLLSPSKIDEALVEKNLMLDIPTREEMLEIELSSRLYKENNNFFMTANLLAQTDLPIPKYDAVTFILTTQYLITLRYIEPQSFKLFTAQLLKNTINYAEPIPLLLGLFDAIVDRLADVLELVEHHLDEFSQQIFQPQAIDPTNTKLDYQFLMRQIGANDDLNSKARESLVAFNRLSMYLDQNAGATMRPEERSQLNTLTKDIIALSDHANFLSNKVNFLLDATLGMVSIEQNNIIKIFSVAAVIFLPPTLIASIYGMNFIHMPELAWREGYLLAIGLMVFSAILPYKYFKYRKWL